MHEKDKKPTLIEAYVDPPPKTKPEYLGIEMSNAFKSGQSYSLFVDDDTNTTACKPQPWVSYPTQQGCLKMKMSSYESYVDVGLRNSDSLFNWTNKLSKIIVKIRI